MLQGSLSSECGFEQVSSEQDLIQYSAKDSETLAMKSFLMRKIIDLNVRKKQFNENTKSSLVLQSNSGDNKCVK